jgi:hypothetical protein
MSFPSRFRRKIDRPLSLRLPKIIGIPAWLLMAAAPLPRKTQDTEAVERKSNSQSGDCHQFRFLELDGCTRFALWEIVH